MTTGNQLDPESQRDLQRLEEQSFQSARMQLMAKDEKGISFYRAVEILGITGTSVRWLTDHEFLIKVKNARGAAKAYFTPRSVFNVITAVVKQDHEYLAKIPAPIRESLQRKKDRLTRLVRYILVHKDESVKPQGRRMNEPPATTKGGGTNGRRVREP